MPAWPTKVPRLPILALLLAALLVPMGPEPALAIETSAARALVVEEATGSVLLDRGADQPFPPGNFTKLLTAAVVFDAIERGDIADDTILQVSEHAWRTGGAPARVTTMFAAVRSKVPVADLLRGLTIHYANDAAIVLAEGLSGTEAAFAERMNRLAAEIGMNASRFANPTGFPAPDAETTLRDMERLVRWMRAEHPGRMALYAQPDFTWNRITQRNKTEPLRTVPSVAGLSLAFDEKAGFAAVIVAGSDDRWLFVGLGGLPDEAARAREIAALVGGVAQDYRTVELFRPADRVGEVEVFGGARTHVPVTTTVPARVTLPLAENAALAARIVYDGPVVAPVGRDQPLAHLEIRSGDHLVRRFPLVAAEDVPAGSLRSRAEDGLLELISGWW
ncbi:D-alanyl-D-alanine carboxypeptidase family protein [Methylobrevis pamukkalensis]|uniref:serine-type D-Ala-D-Ala carboxypeptidase n=1 Tax=Methylobrevis pamukkalensis TaxID=1439726 RepID=A0A1E3H3C9_9HYPH|nr:D-alanyl-D-alanine carboxypeptidase family protein [Methylobrevis pamukkalensis]ODN70822.1 D-alanyl-D-alanine carboxypeptidase DacD precursor [Methylobrevis pamukkalensis]